MKKLRTGLSILFFIVLIVYTMAFAAKNNQPLVLDLLFLDTVELPVSLWVGAILVIGAILGFISNMLLYTKQKLTIRRLRKELLINKPKL